jgi:uncharacterized coiled-coil DUF342 family protein
MAFDMTNIKDYAPLVTAIFGGVGVKMLEKVMSKRSDEFNESSKIREELRQQINSLRTEIEAWKKEADEWREEADKWRKEYWQQIEANIKHKGQYEYDLSQLRAEVEILRSHVNPTTDE